MPKKPPNKPPRRTPIKPPKGPDVTRAADIVYVCGASGSGKSSWVKRRIARAARLSVWDIDREYPDVARYTSAEQFVQALIAARAGGPSRLAFSPAHPTRDLFEFWSRAMLQLGQGWTVVAEETSTVTHAGKAPQYWGDLVRRARKFGISVIAITQRPSESDKTALGNATLIHCGRLTRHDDRLYMAKEMSAPLERVAALQGTEFLELDVTAGRLTSGVTRF